MTDWTQRRGEAPRQEDADEGATAGAGRIGDDTAGATRADGGGTSGGGGTAGGGGGASGGVTGTGDDAGETDGAAQPDADITES